MKTLKDSFGFIERADVVKDVRMVWCTCVLAYSALVVCSDSVHV